MSSRRRVQRFRMPVVAAAACLLAVVLVGDVATAGADRAASVQPLGQVVGSVDGGDAHTCGIQTTRALLCWGSNTLGQSTPPSGTFAAASAGTAFTCGTRTDATLACWGKNDVGQASPPAGAFKQVSSGEAHACAVKADGSEQCWGSNTYGQTTPHAGVTFRQVTAGRRHTCALRSDGLVPCWGDNTFGQTDILSSEVFIQISAGADHTCGVRGSGSVACWGSNASGQGTPPTGTFREVSSGTDNTCGLTAAGTIACWGGNASGQSTPPTGTFTSVTVGALHACGVRTDGSAACWGSNASSQATPKVGIYNSRALDAGFFETCGIRTDGIATCWGDASFGQSSPPNDTFWQISAGLGFSCGIRSDGTLACWGSGYPGSPPQTPPTGTFKQVKVSAAGGVGGHPFACAIRTSGAIACWGDPAGAVTPPASQFFDLGVGQRNACAVMTGGTLTCWGDNSQGESTPPTGSFLQVSGEDYTNGADFTSCALRIDGSLLCWGSNSAGQRTPPAGPFAQFDVGSWFGCGAKVDGTAACWGQNTSGEATPPAGGYLGVTAGDTHACGVKSDGTVVCWGDGSSGELGGTPPKVTSKTPPGAAIGVPYSHAYAATGLAKNAYTRKSGTIPPGLALDSRTGVLSGTPTRLGSYTGVVAVSNGFFLPDAAQSFSILVLPQHTLSIKDRHSVEGSSGAGAVTFPVTLSAPVPTGQTVSVAVDTQDGSATAGSDYTAVSTTMTWGSTDPLTKNATVLVNGDTSTEGTEAFTVHLSSPVGAILADAVATATILDDDGSLYLSVSDTAITEGNTGTSLAKLTVALSAAPAAGESVSVQVATADGTATAGTDYTALATTLTWVAGDALTKTVSVVVKGDVAVEPDETFAVNLSLPTGYTVVSDATALATIGTDD